MEIDRFTNMAQKAIFELETSKPYFALLSNPKTQKSFNNILIKQAPKEFYSVITQLARHILNNTSELENSNFREKYKTSLYLLALPSTGKKEKLKVLEKESNDFFKHLYTIVGDILNNGR